MSQIGSIARILCGFPDIDPLPHMAISLHGDPNLLLGTPKKDI